MDVTRLARRLLDPVPVHRTFGLEVVRAGDEGSLVALTVEEPLTNVVGALHVSGLTTLVDAGGLAAIIGAARSEGELDGVVPLGAAASLRFVAPAYGRLEGSCTLDAGARQAARSVLDRTVGKARIETTTVVRDESGRVVCEGSFEWSVRRED